MEMTEQALEVVLVAQTYYLNGKSKTEISAELQMSRFKVARLLQESLSSGIVSVNVGGALALDAELGSAVEERYGLRRAVVVQQSVPGATPVGRVAARLLERLVRPDDVLGLSWGRALASMVAASPRLRPRALVQLAGGTSPVTDDSGATDLVRRLADVTGARAHVLHAPLFVANALTASELRGDPVNRRTFELFDSLTVAVIGVGSWDPPSSSIAHLMSDHRAQIEAGGGVADVCSTVLDGNGVQIAASVALQAHAISISWGQLLAVPHVVAIAAGEHKAAAIRSALQSGVAHTLVTDMAAASQLVSVAAAAESE
jgi:DNA-binding transcriptional regulator LsrR (DeoR family)